MLGILIKYFLKKFYQTDLSELTFGITFDILLYNEMMYRKDQTEYTLILPQRCDTMTKNIQIRKKY